MRVEPAPGLILGGKYRLERPLAAGGMGSVWVARHLKLDAAVAVKLMLEGLADTSSFARFEREAKACAQLSSPHVVHVHDFGHEDETAFIVMELLHGEDLGDRLDRVGKMSLVESVGYAVPIGKALRVAHDAGLVHRDLKPRNVFIARQGEDEVVKLVDFGIARETRSQLVDDRTTSGIVLGSPYHMAPEQAQALQVDHRADLWAFGVVLYRMLTGRRPFEGEAVTTVLMAICTTPHPLASSVSPGLSPSLDAFFARALAKDPDRRFQTARELVDAFVRVAEERDVSVVAAAPAAAAAPVAEAPLHAAGSTPASAPAAFAPVAPPAIGGTWSAASVAGPLPPAPPVGATAPTMLAVTPAPGAHRPATASDGGSGVGARTTDARDASASRALTAVSTQVPEATSARRRGWVAIVAALAVLGGGGAALLLGLPGARRGDSAGSGASSTTGIRSEPMAATAAPATSPIAVEPAAPAGSVGPEPAPAASSAAPAAASAPAPASAAPPPATPPAPRPPRPEPPPRPSPAARPTVDPFTGLPVGG